MPPCRGGLRYATCLTAPDPTSLQGRAPVRHVSYNSGSCLPTGEVFGAPRVLQLQILFPCRGGGSLEHRVCRGSGPAGSALCPVASDTAFLPGGLWCRHLMPCGFLWTVGLKHKEKRSKPACAASLSHVPNACAHVSKEVDVRVIMGLQDVRTGTTFNACKMCRHAATMQRQYC
jgi:hypothetical protein